MFLLDNEKKGSRQAMSEDIITKILDRDNLNLAFKNVKANKVVLMIYQLMKLPNILEKIKRQLFGNYIIENINLNLCVG